MEVGTKIQMDNGDLGIQEGLVIEECIYGDVVLWDVEDEDEEIVDEESFRDFGIRYLPEDWVFKYINDDGSRK